MGWPVFSACPRLFWHLLWINETMLDSVFERSSDALLQVLQLSLDECISLDHKYICTDHVLPALASEYGGVACEALATMKVDEDSVRKELENQVKGKTESELQFSDGLTCRPVCLR